MRFVVKYKTSFFKLYSLEYYNIKYYTYIYNKLHFNLNKRLDIMTFFENKLLFIITTVDFDVFKKIYT